MKKENFNSFVFSLLPCLADNRNVEHKKEAFNLFSIKLFPPNTILEPDDHMLQIFQSGCLLVFSKLDETTLTGNRTNLRCT
jgi:hypothetical protein